MALLDPQPTSGSWVKIDSYTGGWTQQASGSWAKIDSYTGPWAQQTSGSWVKINSYTGWKQGGWHVGRVVW